MPTSPELFIENRPELFWKPLTEPAPAAEEWAPAVSEAANLLPPAARAAGDGIPALLAATLGEGQFGERHWELGLAQRTYYAVKPLLPRALTRRLRRAQSRLRRPGNRLGWPVERRYADFQLGTVAALLRRRRQPEMPFLHLWPEGRRVCLVLTHDVETAAGLDQVLRVAGLERRYGFRSQFNLVPERYRLDRGLIAELRQEGFELGVHDLNHDGRLFSSRAGFQRRAARINRHLADLGASGFRAALTHRQPVWMQRLEIDYDLSFFDTDPFEPIPGGTMSLWPFFLGRFVELPMTLVQDYTLTAVLGERSPRLWLDKVSFLAERCGAVVINSHPDYLRDSSCWRVYEAFLGAMAERTDCWPAFPAQVARWWRARAAAARVADLEGGVEARIVLSEDAPAGATIEVPGRPG